MTVQIDDYIPTDSWVRNYRAMSTTKLLDVLAGFNTTRNHGLITEAVYRVMQHGGDIDTNHERCWAEARRRGLIAS